MSENVQEPIPPALIGEFKHTNRERNAARLDQVATRTLNNSSSLTKEYLSLFPFAHDSLGSVEIFVGGMAPLIVPVLTVVDLFRLAKNSLVSATRGINKAVNHKAIDSFYKKIEAYRQAQANYPAQLKQWRRAVNAAIVDQRETRKAVRREELKKRTRANVDRRLMAPHKNIGPTS